MDLISYISITIVKHLKLKKMANYNKNEEALLTYLEELKEQTLSAIFKETEVHNYWASGEYKKDSSLSSITKHQFDFYTTNSQNRLKPLRFRLMWLEGQIEEIKMLSILA